jgi:hypothetical protein
MIASPVSIGHKSSIIFVEDPFLSNSSVGIDEENPEPVSSSDL